MFSSIIESVNKNESFEANARVLHMPASYPHSKMTIINSNVIV